MCDCLNAHLAHLYIVHTKRVLILTCMSVAATSVAYQVQFTRQLSGHKEIHVVNCHWHNSMAKVQFGVMRVRATKWLVDMIKKYKVRFVMGDLNMSAYDVCTLLRDNGIECNLVAWHCELDKDTDYNTFLYDSCVIVAIGGMRYPPKLCTTMVHCLTAAQMPWVLEDEKRTTRGYAKRHYIMANTDQFPDAVGSPSLRNEAMRMASVAQEFLTCRDCRPDRQHREGEVPGDRCLRHAYIDPNPICPRYSGPVRERGDQQYEITADWPVLDEIKEKVCKPCIADPHGRRWNRAGHMVVTVVFGKYRGRSEGATKRRADRQANGTGYRNPQRRQNEWPNKNEARACGGQASSNYDDGSPAFAADLQWTPGSQRGSSSQAVRHVRSPGRSDSGGMQSGSRSVSWRSQDSRDWWANPRDDRRWGDHSWQDRRADTWRGGWS